MRKPKYVPDTHYEMKLAAEAIVDPRTVRKFLTGQPVGARTVQRIKVALAKVDPKRLAEMFPEESAPAAPVSAVG
jgi:hypothetical protein